MFCSKCGKQAEGEYCWNCGAKLYVPTNDTPKDTPEKESTVQKPLASYSTFSATKSYPLETGTFDIDSTHQMMRFMPSFGSEGVYFHFQDILDAELVKNGTSVFKTSTSSMITRTVLGSAISGGFGVVAGATAKRNETQYITELYVRVLLKNHPTPMARIPIINGKSESGTFVANVEMANVELVLSEIKNAQVTPILETAYAQHGLSLAAASASAKRTVTSEGNQNWRCPKCDYSNRGTVSVCANCGYAKSAERAVPKVRSEPETLPPSDSYTNEDWYCPECDYKNRATNKTCTSCGAVRPLPEQEKKKFKKLFSKQNS